MYVLGCVSSVVHHEKLNILQVVNEERLVAGGHHVACLSVGAKSNLSNSHQYSLRFSSGVSTTNFYPATSREREHLGFEGNVLRA